MTKKQIIQETVDEHMKKVTFAIEKRLEEMGLGNLPLTDEHFYGVTEPCGTNEIYYKGSVPHVRVITFYPVEEVNTCNKDSINIQQKFY